MSSSDTLTSTAAAELADQLDATYGDFSALVRQDRELPTPETVQRLMTVAMKLYVAHHERGERFDPVGPDVGATEVAILASAMLDAVNLEVFELSIWHGLSHENPLSHQKQGRVGVNAEEQT